EEEDENGDDEVVVVAEEEEDGDEEEEEAERDGVYIEGGIIDKILGDDFDELYDVSANNQGNSARETGINEGTNINDSTNVIAVDVLSDLSISPSSVFHGQQKHQLTDTESLASNKRSRVTDRRKKPPTLDPNSSPETQKRSFLGSFERAYMQRNTALDAIEARKLELEEGRIELEKAKEARIQDMEAEKLALEKAKEAKRQELDERRLKLEEKKLESETQREVLQLITAGLGKGMSFEQIQELLKFTKSHLI
ncbi:hypothetical protein BGZ47_011807, partial [Haplosporangium gracile]